LFRVTREKADEEFRLEAMWSYRANPPMTGNGDDAKVIPFDEWMDRMAGVESVEVIPEISDEELDQLLAMGRIGMRPPGM